MPNNHKIYLQFAFKVMTDLPAIKETKHTNQAMPFKLYTYSTHATTYYQSWSSLHLGPVYTFLFVYSMSSVRVNLLISFHMNGNYLTSLLNHLYVLYTYAGSLVHPVWFINACCCEIQLYSWYTYFIYTALHFNLNRNFLQSLRQLRKFMRQ